MTGRFSVQIALAVLTMVHKGQALALDVESICNKTHLKTVNLVHKDRDANIKIIREHDIGTSDEAKFLKNYYSSPEQSLNKDSISKMSLDGNRKHIPNSELKDLFLRYSTQEQKLSNPSDFRKVVLSTINQLLPKTLNKVDWFLNLKNEQISHVNIRPGGKDDFGDIYGAVTNYNKDNYGKYSIEIIFSNNESEPIPYLIPLVIHELEHTVNFKEKISLEKNPSNFQEYLTVEEAKGFNSQMTAYISLIERQPDLFCNWLYRSWSYGDILVPLSWTMASMEKEMKEGAFLYRYTKEGLFKDNKSLFNSSGTDLNPSIKRRVESLNLKYIK